MAITGPHPSSKSVIGKFRREMSLEEFKNWLLKSYDKDNDGKISQEELREAVRATGAWFTTWKSRRGLKVADTDGNGFVDMDEVKNLVEFAEKELGLKIICC